MKRSTKRRRMSQESAQAGFHRGGSLAATTALCTAGQFALFMTAHAQEPSAQAERVISNAEEAVSGEEDVTQLPEFVVEGEDPIDYKPEAVQSPRLNQPLVDIPQTITVVPEDVIEQRNATSLRDVLRNVPGISIQAGEGGTTNGDQFSIRGFSARTDIYIDGVRDMGGYTRDPFNLEQVEVAKGPSSSISGRGSTGGAVNLVTKKPQPVPFYTGDVGVGTDDYFRSTLDINQPLNETTGVRFNALYHNADWAGIDIATDERWGFDGAITFGMGTDTRLTASYFHLEQESIPYYGIPWVPATVTDPRLTPFIDQPAPVNYSNFYGVVGRDFEEVTTDVGSISFEHDFSERFSVRNHTQIGSTDRLSIVTAPRFSTGTNIRRSDSKDRDETNTIYSNQTDFDIVFDTGPILHEVVTGFDLVWEDGERHILNMPTSIDTSLFNPDPFDPVFGKVSRTGARNESDAFSTGAYLFDTLNIGEKWEITGGARYDHFELDYTTLSEDGVSESIGRTDDVWSTRAAVVYKPQEDASIYFGYGTSFNPAGESLSLSTSETSASNIEVDPEKNETFELGTKWNVLEDRLALTGALFRTEKTNARTQDPVDPTDFLVLEGEQVVQGIELGAAGSITEWWQVFGGYTFLDTEITSSLNRDEVGKEVSNAPEHSFNLWTVVSLPYGFSAGAGVNYVDDRFSNNTNSRLAPSYTTVDAMIGYEVNENFSLRLNVLNLGDEEYIDKIGGGHFIPGTGRAAMLTGSIRF